jgi:hypothetical protein
MNMFKKIVIIHVYGALTPTTPMPGMGGAKCGEKYMTN